MKTLFSLTFSFTTALLCAQVEAITTDGRNVLLHQDGTYSFYEKQAAQSDSIDCTQYTKIERDRVKGIDRLNPIESIIIQDGAKYVVLNPYTDSDMIFFAYIVQGLSPCIDEGAEINFLLRDETRMTFKNQLKFSCEGTGAFYFDSSQRMTEALRQLSTKEVEIVRVHTFEKIADFELTSEQSKALMYAIRCMVLSLQQ